MPQSPKPNPVITIFECELVLNKNQFGHYRIHFDGYIGLTLGAVYYLDWGMACCELILTSADAIPWVGFRNGKHEFVYWFDIPDATNKREAKLMENALLKSGWVSL